MQITAPISHGSSGSPVMDETGQVIRIATLGIAEGQNLNFAIPVEKVSAARGAGHRKGLAEASRGPAAH
jgi:S1-C subfamily serine protease